jgi:hypothetical protein
MDPKPRPNHRIYLEILSRMTPEQRLNKVFELNEFVRDLFAAGLRRRFPDVTEDEFHKILLDHLAQCHNENY